MEELAVWAAVEVPVETRLLAPALAAGPGALAEPGAMADLRAQELGLPALPEAWAMAELGALEESEAPAEPETQAVLGTPDPAGPAARAETRSFGAFWPEPPARGAVAGPAVEAGSLLSRPVSKGRTPAEPGLAPPFRLAWELRSPAARGPVPLLRRAGES
jgi:hypothetical protein